MDKVDKESKNKLYQLQMFQQQLQQVEQQKEHMQQRLMELEVTKSGIEALESDEKELMYPLGAGIFIEGHRDRLDSVLVPVGAGVLVRKDVKSAKEYVEKIRSDVLSSIEQIDRQIAKMSEVCNKIVRDMDNNPVKEELNQ